MHIERPSGTHFGAGLAGGILSDREQLVGEYVFGVDEATSIVNRADPDNPLTVVGAPTYNSDHCLIQPHPTDAGRSGFHTDINLNMRGTLILVRQNSSVNATGMCMGISSATHCGFGQWSSNNRAAFCQNAQNQGSWWARSDNPSPAIFFEAAVFPIAGGVGEGYHSDGGALFEVDAYVTSDSSPAEATDIPYKEGSEVLIGAETQSSNSSMTYPVYFAAIYQKPLTPAEVAVAYAEIKAWLLAERGVVVE